MRLSLNLSSMNRFFIKGLAIFVLSLNFNIIDSPWAMGSVTTCSRLLRQPLVHSEILNLRQFVKTKVLGQDALVDLVFVALLVPEGHILIEGPTGVAKTRLVKVLAKAINAQVSEEQMTAYTSPPDLKGSRILNQETGKFEFHPGTLLKGNFVLLDELNRAPDRTLNAALSAMAEGEVSIGGEIKTVPADLYMILATQNPAHHAGTNVLPEAIVDRFLFKLNVDYTSSEVEGDILEIMMAEKRKRFEVQDEKSGGKSIEQDIAPLSIDVIVEARRQVLELPLGPDVKQYLLKIVDLTRNPSRYSSPAAHSLMTGLALGVGPRATAALAFSAKAFAWLNGHSEVQRSDVSAVARSVLSHRLKLSDEARIGHLTEESVVDTILEAADAP